MYRHLKPNPLPFPCSATPPSPLFLLPSSQTPQRNLTFHRLLRPSPVVRQRPDARRTPPAKPHRLSSPLCSSLPSLSLSFFFSHNSVPVLRRPPQPRHCSDQRATGQACHLLRRTRPRRSLLRPASHQTRQRHSLSRPARPRRLTVPNRTQGVRLHSGHLWPMRSFSSSPQQNK